MQVVWHGSKLYEDIVLNKQEQKSVWKKEYLDHSTVLAQQALLAAANRQCAASLIVIATHTQSEGSSYSSSH